MNALLSQKLSLQGGRASTSRFAEAMETIIKGNGISEAAINNGPNTFPNNLQQTNAPEAAVTLRNQNQDRMRQCLTAIHQ